MKWNLSLLTNTAIAVYRLAEKDNLLVPLAASFQLREQYHLRDDSLRAHES